MATPAPIRERKPYLPPLDIAHEHVIARARAELEALTKAHDDLWQFTSAEWNVDMPSQSISFTTDDYIATAALQVIGSLAIKRGQWMWGWDHPSVPPTMALDAAKVRQYGKARGLERHNTRIIAAEEDECWTFTALAAMFSGRQGAYRVPTGESLVFITFGSIRLEQRA